MPRTLRPALLPMIAVGLSILACSGGADGPQGPAGGPTAAAPAPAQPGEASAAPAAKAKGKGKAKAKAGQATDAPGGRIVAQPRGMCVPDCQLLTAYTLDEVQQNYCALCGAHDEAACTLDWPSSDVPSCEIWDFYRNCVYATYGRTFQKQQWRDAFEKQPWYQPDPAYSDARLSPVAEANIQELVRRKEQKVQCMD